MGGTHAGDGRDGFNKTHEEHQSFIRHTAEKFHLTKSQGSLTRKTVRRSGAAGLPMALPGCMSHAQALLPSSLVKAVCRQAAP